MRVSSITELAVVFDGLVSADWRAHRVRNVLQYVFEKHFEFAFEKLRRKTLELATKQLHKIRDLLRLITDTLQVVLAPRSSPPTSR